MKKHILTCINVAKVKVLMSLLKLLDIKDDTLQKKFSNDHKAFSKYFLQKEESSNVLYTPV